MFLSREHLTDILEITPADYMKVIRPIEQLIIDFDKVLEEIDHEYKARIDFALFNITNVLLSLEHQFGKMKHAIQVKQYYIMSLIEKDSELVVNDMEKICFDKKQRGAKGYENHHFLTVTNTQKYDFSKIIVRSHYQSFFMNHKDFRKKNGEMFSLEEIEYKIGMLKNLTYYLKSLNYNLK